MGKYVLDVFADKDTNFLLWEQVMKKDNEKKNFFRQVKKDDSLTGYRDRVGVELFLKSLFYALATAFLAMTVLTWGLSALHALIKWVVVVVGVVILIGCTLWYYFKVFLPKDDNIADRLDNFGLDERAITMVEFADDKSYIAQRQREDATSHIEKIPPKSVRLKFPVLALILCLVMGAAFAPTIVIAKDNVDWQNYYVEKNKEIIGEIDKELDD
ncbi:MAG: hypothetical protein ILP02_04280, partial [Clostridia bacterium]|nr:hypothetical protein [Clostridia bacterium]